MVEIVPKTAEHYEIARLAWRRYGKGRHAAALNIGDGCTCAPARATRLPLLFTG